MKLTISVVAVITFFISLFANVKKHQMQTINFSAMHQNLRTIHCPTEQGFQTYQINIPAEVTNIDYFIAGYCMSVEANLKTNN